VAKLLILQELEYELLGPMYLSSSLKKAGHQCNIKVGKKMDDFTEAINKVSPDIIGFSSVTGSHNWAVNIASEVKKKFNLPTIFGGPHPTFFPDFINESSVDMLVRGEGEETMVEILDCLESNRSFEKIPNVIFKDNRGAVISTEVRHLKANLDDLPFPDRNLYNEDKHLMDRNTFCVITSRGCPYNCSFCFQDGWQDLYKGKGKIVRLRSIDNVIAECAEIKERYNPQAFNFKDDVFGLKKSWLYEFLERYKKEIGLEFLCLVRADVVGTDPEYAQRLADAGCKMVCIGIESGSEKTRNLLLNKRLDDNKILKSAEYLHKVNIKFLTLNMLGLPGESYEEAKKTVELNMKIKADYPWCSLFLPLPGTKLAEYAVNHGYLDSGYQQDTDQKSFYTPSTMNSPEIKKIENLQRFFQTAVLWPWSYPILKRLINLKPNRLFTWWFGLVYFYIHTKSDTRSKWEILKFALRNYRQLLGN